jgi:hypothetical protein
VTEKKTVFKPKDLFSEWNSYDDDLIASRCYEVDCKFIRFREICEFDDMETEKSKIVIAQNYKKIK